jgi:carbon-monoxide dehydrogenase large subunit
VTDGQLAGRPVYIGARLPRVEDERLLAGRGRYVADVHLPGAVEMVVLRSQLAHANVRVDLSAVSAADGVVAAVTADDLVGVSPIPDFFTDARPVREFLLQQGRARYVGAPLAAVVAADRYLAEDALELAQVEYEDLPAVTTIEDALAPGAPLLFDDWPDNRVVVMPDDDPETDRVFASAWGVVHGRYRIQRHTAVPLETRGAIAEYRDGRLTVWTSSQIPHILRTLIAMVLHIPERDIRVIAPDVGGGFGAKAQVFPEEFLVCWLARRLGRPVRFVEDRNEHLQATGHARDQLIDLEAAIDEQGRIQAVRGSIFHDVGSGEIYPCGFNPSAVTWSAITGPYRIAHQRVDVTCVVTNKTPSGAYRGFGNPEAAFVIERLMQKAAVAAGVDPLELRRSMLLAPDDLPYTTPTGSIVSSGSHRPAFEAVIEGGKVAVERARARFAGRSDVRIGLGFANYLEGTVPSYFPNTGNWGGQDSVSVRFEPDGGVTVASGVTTTGQGVRTMLATLAADTLGVPLESIRVVIGDTDEAPYGLGGWGSRSTGVAGGAMLKAAGTVREKARRIAAHLLEAAPEDVIVADGAFRVAGSPESSVTWRDVATAAYVRTLDLPTDVEPGLESTATFVPPGIDHRPRPDGRMNACATYTNASHAAVVKVDLGTGAVTVLEYLVVHDCGTLINPVIVEGQIHGGVAQGLGGALLEDLPYTPEGQPMAVTFMDYLLPSATDVPPISIEHFESPDPNMPYGAKGAGEAGIIGPAAAVAWAVEDALAEFEIDEITETPVTAPFVWRSLQAARARTSAASPVGTR